ncbi:methyltransferase domain-containing protein [Candidatus Magnetaquicoccus inordinatus]|uniref:methyltransferase domain-containing protein n=1 Tax=Candidatus Magnetaquicoccus inordinatus TaxID=2496818 RepID=UPI00102BF38F|nr:class I SAM-dependent methyltransferase [Candidatus Magnetaquicoccus inordinatus]
MMLEAVRLQKWYNSPEGQTVADLIGEIMLQWLSVNHPSLQLLGLGYTQPYLDRLVQALPVERCRHPLAASPAEMGVLPWPSGSANRVAQIRPDALPFADTQFNQVIMSHFLESCASSQAALRETWRILTPGGRLLIMVPNRGGMWARRDHTPFGWGHPFSPGQLAELLTDSLFIPRQSRFALFMPPLGKRYFPQAAPAWEKAGNRWFAPLGGVILCEAEKVVYALTPLGKQSAHNLLQRPLSQSFAPRFHKDGAKRSQ